MLTVGNIDIMDGRPGVREGLGGVPNVGVMTSDMLLHLSLSLQNFAVTPKESCQEFAHFFGAQE